MGKTRYDKCREVLEPIKGMKITTNGLNYLVKTHIAGSEKTAFEIMDFMREMKLIKDIGNCRWKVMLK